MDTIRWVGIGVGALFGVTIVMLVRSASGGSSGSNDGGSGIDTGLGSSEAQTLTPEWEDQDFKTLADIAQRYKMNPADLLIIMASEAGLKPQAANRNAEGYPVAVGLIQLTSVANSLVGISEGQRVEVPTWTVAQQLSLVDKFFAGNPWTTTGKGYDSAGAVYGANFAPGRMLSRGTAPSTILYDDTEGSAYSANKGFDVAGKGNITIQDLIDHLRIVVNQPVYLAGLQRLRDATGDQTLSPSLPNS